MTSTRRRQTIVPDAHRVLRLPGSNVGLYDTNTAQPMGTLTMTAQITGASSSWSAIIISIAPAVANASPVVLPQLVSWF